MISQLTPKPKAGNIGTRPKNPKIMALVDRPNIPLKQRKRLVHKNHLTGKPEQGVITYFFDEEGRELGYSTPATPHGMINNSTAGRVWSEERKNQLI